MAIKLFATDMDGTLLVDNRIPRENIDALKSLQEKGITIACVTGRVKTSVFWLTGQADLNTIVVANNGAIAYSKDHRKLLAEAMEKETVEKLIAFGNKYQIPFHLYDEDTFYTNKLDLRKLDHLLIDDFGGYSYQVNVSVSMDLVKTLDREGTPIFKLQYMVEGQLMDDLMNDLKEIEGIYVTRSQENLLEVQSEKVDKWQSLLYAARDMGINEDEIATIGDYENDLPMIKNAKIGFAMGNAMDRIKEEADYVVSDNENFGVREACNTILSGEVS